MQTRCRAGIAAVVLALVAVFAADLAAQKQGGDQPSPSEWTGTIVVTNNYSVKTKNGRSEHHSRYALVLTQGGGAVATGELQAFGYGSDGQLIEKLEGSYTDQVPNVEPRLFSCRIDNGMFGFRFGTQFHPKVWAKISQLANRNGPGGGLKPDYYWFTQPAPMEGPGDTINGKCEPGASTLIGRRTIPLKNQGQYPEGTELSGGATTTWNLTRNEKLEVVVEIPGYDKWLPKGTKDEEKAGNTLEVKARLKTKDGSPLQEKARKFTFELLRVSQEPGVCMNYPATPKKDPDPDLQFDQKAQQDLVVVDDQDQPVKNKKGLKVRSKKEGDQTQATAVVGAYDWGAYGEIRVTAEMPNKREIIGYLKTDKGNPNIRLPKRKDGSFIADAWKEKWKKEVPKILELADDDDTEDDPHGSKHEPDPGPGPGMCAHCAGKRQCLGGHKGDGLTLYEEYRGFYVNGKHVCGHPGKKDVFIHRRKDVSGQAREGILLFASITGLNVHVGLRDDEIGPKTEPVNYDPEGEAPKGTPPGELTARPVWVNANVRKETSRDGVPPPPTLGPKYGILMAATPRAGPARGYGFPGWPKKVALGSTFVPGDWNEFRTGTGELLRRDRYPRYLAHELLHCCNVSHHGPRYENGKLVRGKPDLGFVFWKLDGQKVVQTLADDNGDPKVDAGGKPVQDDPIPLRDVQWEDGNAVDPKSLAEWLSMTVFEHNRDAGAQVYVASQGGEHSGYQDCVMRWEGASVFLKDHVYYLNRKQGQSFELTPMSLCDWPDDRGVSLPGLTLPALGRYGNAPNGFCKSQICVNDARHTKP
jgi:hypothetical protein